MSAARGELVRTWARMTGRLGAEVVPVRRVVLVERFMHPAASGELLVDEAGGSTHVARRRCQGRR